MSAQAFLAAAEAYDAAMSTGADDDMRRLFAATAQIWHNTDGLVQSIEENLRLGHWLRRRVPDLTFTDVRLTLTTEGFVRRHRMVGTLRNGETFQLHSCLVATVAEGLIVRVDEYLDSAGLLPLRMPPR